MDIVRIFALSCSCVFVMGNVGVPVIMLKHASVTSSMPKPLAGHTIASDDFSDLLKLFSKPDLTITFLQDELSNEDFLRLDKDMKRGGLFKNVQRFSGSDTSVFFPSVKSPAHGLKTLTVQYDDQLEFADTDNVVSYLTKTKLQAGTAVIVHLFPTADEETSSQAIQHNDAIIGEVMRLVEETGLSYIAVFTANLHRRSHEVVVAQRSVGRHLLEAPIEIGSNNETMLWNGTNCMIYVENLVILGVPQGNISLDIMCTNSTNNTMSLKIAENSTLVEMIYLKNVTTGYWYLVSMNIGDSTVTNIPDISAPDDFSYHCNEPIKFMIPDSVNGSDVVGMQVSRIQIQLFSFNQADVFGLAYDCTGFFTLPLWTGLIISLLLISVTVYGMSMLASIQTFDQYDDPKSKPLTINVSE